MRPTVTLTLAAALALVSFASSAAGDPEAGKLVFKKCAICHDTQAGKNKIGPSLHDIIGRHSGTADDYTYSDAMKKADKTWDAATLDQYLTNPRGLVPGTKMIFPGLKDQKDRDDVIAYLETLK